MPYTVHKGAGGRPWKLIKKTTGETVGSSTSKGDAMAAMRARYAAEENPEQMGKGKFGKLRKYLGR